MSNSTFGYYTTKATITVTADSRADAEKTLDKYLDFTHGNGDIAIGIIDNEMAFEAIDDQEPVWCRTCGCELLPEESIWFDDDEYCEKCFAEIGGVVTKGSTAEG